MKKLIILLLLFSHYSFANNNGFADCKLQVLAFSCNISSDKKSPKYMRHGGEAACFAGLDLTKEYMPEKQKVFSNIIESQAYQREKHKDKISDINRCFTNINMLQKCDLGFVTAKGHENINSCKVLIEKNNLLSVKRKEEIEVTDFDFNLPDRWMLFSDRSKKGFIWKQFVDKNQNKILLKVSPKMKSSEYQKNVKMIEKRSKEYWAAEDVKLNSHKVIDIGSHKLVDEQIGTFVMHRTPMSTYHIYGKNKIAIIHVNLNGLKEDIRSLSRGIVNTFKWKK